MGVVEVKDYLVTSALLLLVIAAVVVTYLIGRRNARREHDKKTSQEQLTMLSSYMAAVSVVSALVAAQIVSRDKFQQAREIAAQRIRSQLM